MRARTNPYAGRYIVSKMAKTRAIAANPLIRGHIPETKSMNKESLHRMLHKHKMVYIKPNSGTFGNGVMRVEWNERDPSSPYHYQNGTRKKRFGSFHTMYTAIRKDMTRKNYLVQKGIHLLKYRGNRFDIRVMVQQSPNRKWETTGIIGRVAHPQKIVTNFHNGGKLMPVETLLAGYLSRDNKQRYIHKLKKLGLQVAKAMHVKYKKIKEIGLDVAVENDLKPWILEVNTSPDPYIFRRLKDKRIFQKIYRYAKAYKRI